MTNAGLGSVGARYAVELGRTDPIIFYAASREWAERTTAIIKKFRDAIAEAAAIVNGDRDKASMSISKFTKQPSELVKATPPESRSDRCSSLSNWRGGSTCDVIAENATVQARHHQTGPELRAQRWRLSEQSSQPDSEAGTLSRRAATLVEHDILTGHLAPGARLGLSIVQRYEIERLELREGLSRLVSRGLIVGIGQRGFFVSPTSAGKICSTSPACAAVRIEAVRLAIESGDDVWEAGILSALHQMRRHIERTGNEFREGAESFDRLHKGFPAPPCWRMTQGA